MYACTVCMHACLRTYVYEYIICMHVYQDGGKGGAMGLLLSYQGDHGVVITILI